MTVEPLTQRLQYSIRLFLYTYDYDTSIPPRCRGFKTLVDLSRNENVLRITRPLFIIIYYII